MNAYFMNSPLDGDSPTICRKCGALLTPVRGDFFVVEVEAYAENSPPVFTKEDLAKDHRAEMERLAKAMAELSPQEAMDTVHRHMTFFLCRPCHTVWIENPVGR
jgi:hypothetical protein